MDASTATDANAIARKILVKVALAGAANDTEAIAGIEPVGRAHPLEVLDALAGRVVAESGEVKVLPGARGYPRCYLRRDACGLVVIAPLGLWWIREAAGAEWTRVRDGAVAVAKLLMERGASLRGGRRSAREVGGCDDAVLELLELAGLITFVASGHFQIEIGAFAPAAFAKALAHEGAPPWPVEPAREGVADRPRARTSETPMREAEPPMGELPLAPMMAELLRFAGERGVDLQRRNGRTAKRIATDIAALPELRGTPRVRVGGAGGRWTFDVDGENRRKNLENALPPKQ